MQKQLLIKAIVGMSVSFSAANLHADVSLAQPVINNITASDGQITLSWSGGRASYQVQAAARLFGNWVNIGAPTSNNVAVIPMNGSQAFFRVVSDFTARYQVVFNATWSQATHPTNWPANAHFSGLVGGTHNASVHFWRDGETASEGMRLMAELGQKTTLLNEIAPAISSGTAHFQLSGGGISPSPGSVSLTFPQPMSRNFPLVTLVSMIAPSPDWFVGVDSLNLIENGQWVTNNVVTLYAKDTGTDSGVSYASPDLVTVPRGVVTQFTGFPAIQNGVIVPFGTFTFTRLD
ncbi:MAG: hypothetical protein EXS35_03505 [Pedosphaera sp.]|nr:hypothetical protein [Pedosphaera sp.]